MGSCFFNSKNFNFLRKKKKFSNLVAQQCECTEHHTVHLKVVE